MGVLRQGPCSLPWPQQRWQNKLLITHESFRLSTSIYDFPVPSGCSFFPIAFQEPKLADCHPISPPTWLPGHPGP